MARGTGVRFTTLDLAAILGVVAILAAAMPYVQSSRESSRRGQCQNNLKNVVLSALGFAARNGGLPPAKTYYPVAPSPAGDASISSVFCRLLPDLDEPVLFNDLNIDVPMYAIGDLPAENRTVAATQLALMRCPDNGYVPPAPFAATNYRANVGPGEIGFSPVPGLKPLESVEQSRGAIDEMRIVPLAEFADGTAGTIAFAEKLTGSGEDPFDPMRDWVPFAPPGAAWDADAWVRICSAVPASAAAVGRTDSGRCWLLSGALYTTYRGNLPPNSPIPDCGSDFLNGVGAFGPRSNHAGGLFVAWADGSVRWIDSTINPNVWRAQQTRQGSDLFGDGSY